MYSENQSYRCDEEALIIDASNGDLNAFNQLVIIHQDLLYHHAYTLLNEPAAAEDVVQESFIKAFRGLQGFRGGSFRAWLLRIVTNSAYDLLRQSQKHPTQPLILEDENGEELESAPWLIDPAASVEKTVERNELSDEIHRLMDQLPEAYRNVLKLVDLYEFDYLEAAETLRIPVGTVKSRLARARFQMKKLLTGNSESVAIFIDRDSVVIA